MNALKRTRRAKLLSPWERLGEGACMSAKLEQAIKANLRGLGYGG